MGAAARSRAYLDIGCGSGMLTSHLAPFFGRVVGIDIEEERLHVFRARAAGDRRLSLLCMSGGCTGFRDGSFGLITLFEVLEHVESVEDTAREVVRLLADGGLLVISVPQLFFPFENHGMQIGARVIHAKIPLLPYIRPLHRRYSRARVFTSPEVERLFAGNGLELLGTGYAAQQFERAGAHRGRWERYCRFLRPLLTRCERVPVVRALVGVSMLKAYRKRA
jgi:SAM-dependent methyltransferase